MRRFKTQEELESEVVRLKPGEMPTHKKLIIYGRQSTSDQVRNNKESTEQQTTDLLALGLDLGWKQEDTTLYIENRFTKDGKITDQIRNASGTLRIDQRPGLNAVKQRIEGGEVGALLVWDVSRLFRDEDMVEPAVFVKMCKQHGVIILTYDDQFDFTISRRNDRKRFMDEAQAAADFITKHIKRMNLARDKVAGRGEYAGGVVPVGFTVAGKHFVPYPPHAEQVAYLFRRFRELGGVVTQLGREVYGKPIFPEVPEGIQLPRLTRVSGGGYTYHSYAGLKKLLTNPVYIGHLSYNGRLVKENAHPAIVVEEDFWYAFNLLSETDMKGNVIERPEKAVRYQQKTSMPTTALLQGTRLKGTPVIRSTENPVYLLDAQGQKASYTIMNPAARLGLVKEHFVASILVKVLDQIISDHIVGRVEQIRKIRSRSESLLPVIDELAGLFPGNRLTELAESLIPTNAKLSPYDYFQAVSQQGATNVTNIEDSIAEYQTEINRLDREYKVNFDLLTDKELRDNRQKKNRLISQIEGITRKHEQAAEVEKVMREGEKLLQDAPSMWAKWSTEKRQKFIRLATEDIILDKVPDADGWLRLVVVWSPYIRQYQVDVCYIWRWKGGRRAWSEQEEAILREYYSTAEREWLLEQLPERNWQSIRGHAREDLGLSRPYQPLGESLPSWMSVNDKKLIDRLGLPVDQPGQREWWVKSGNIKHGTNS